MTSVSTSLPESLPNAGRPPVTGQPPHAIPLAAEAGQGNSTTNWKRSGWRYLARRVNPLYWLYARIMLSRAKHRSLAGHTRLAQRLARLLPNYQFGAIDAFAADGAPADVEQCRHLAFRRLGKELQQRSPASSAMAARLRAHVSDAQFVDSYRVPFPFRDLVRDALPIAAIADASQASQIRDLDGNWFHDLGGSYGVNLFGSDFYKACLNAGMAEARSLGLVLGPYHPVVIDNVDRLRAISGLDEISFHMSGTEAVMQAVRVARYHTGRSHVVRFAGAYHGWWDGVQAGPGNPRPSHEVYTLAEMSDRTLRLLEVREDIACVLVNPIQAMHPNRPPPSDATLIASDRRCAFDRASYAAWLCRLRQVCTDRKIVLIFDEVFLGFRLARGGVQEYFGVSADLVTYGKSLGGGLPVGVLAGKASLMRRFNEQHPGDVCFARGTFNAHPHVMTCMNWFLRHLDSPTVNTHYQKVDGVWNRRAALLNRRFQEERLPLRVVNMTSVWSVLFTVPSRYNWMLQFYLRAEGISLAWIGTGRLIFSHDISEHAMQAIMECFVRAARRMQDDGWWWTDSVLTNKAIKRQVLREVVGALRRSGSNRGMPAHASSDLSILL